MTIDHPRVSPPEPVELPLPRAEVVEAQRQVRPPEHVEGPQVIIGRGPRALRAARSAVDHGCAMVLVGVAGMDHEDTVISLVGGDQRLFDKLRAGEGSRTTREVRRSLPMTVGDAARADFERLADREAVIVQPEANLGKLILVGGGPGPTDLLTVRAVRALAEADLVLVDRLAPQDDLAELAPGALIVDVGKRPGHHPVPQQWIESEAVAHALAGATVVRLKGGDPYVFGRGGEERAAAQTAGVPVEVVPGVSSAISVPGAAGIPITTREVSHGFTVISGHAPLSEGDLRHLVGLGGTIVCLMGLTNLPHLTAGLLRHGIGPRTPAVAIERGFHPSQRNTFSTVADLVGDCSRIGVTAPAVIVIGDVVSAASTAWWDG